MPRAKISDADFIGQFEKIGPLKLSRLLQCAPASVFSRRERIERKLGRQITGPDHRRNTRHNVAHPQRIQLEVKSGIVLVGSDAHYWPGEPSTAHRAFVKFCREMKPAAVIMNGDVLDCATVSRHPPIGWEARPSLIDEIELAKDRLFEIEREPVNSCFSQLSHIARCAAERNCPLCQTAPSATQNILGVGNRRSVLFPRELSVVIPRTHYGTFCQLDCSHGLPPRNL